MYPMLDRQLWLDESSLAETIGGTAIVPPAVLKIHKNTSVRKICEGGDNEGSFLQ